MSLFKSIVGAVLPAVGTFFGGPVGGAIGTAVGGALSRGNGGGQMFPTATTSATGGGPMLTMGALPAISAAAGTAVRVGMAGARAVARSANVYCRRHPAWCASIGGLPGVVSMLESGQLPVVRRRRGRGLTPRDLRSFKRVANLIRGFCPTVRRIPPRATRHVRATGITHS